MQTLNIEPTVKHCTSKGSEIFHKWIPYSLILIKFKPAGSQYDTRTMLIDLISILALLAECLNNLHVSMQP